MSASSAGTRRIGGMKWWHGLVCGAALAWMPGYALLIGVLLAPVLILHILDFRRSEEMARILAPYAFAALIHPFHQLWSADGTLDAAFAILSDPMTSILSWGATALAWLIFEGGMLGIRLWRQYQMTRQKAEWTARLKAVQDEWGDEEASPPSSVGAGATATTTP
ncbi:hypothetical protein [Acetobacter estunensis]|uniref:hypothetical protein n=1 Tax=Acetobacter estunensis TaxID=104097 RepID=UPI001C2D5751|nr:hypothetical protein [Acetobacter estunensis]MBV1836549.1 hypothetical protein [Acetobacter estunensis]